MRDGEGERRRDRAERKENALWAFLAKEPDCRERRDEETKRRRDGEQRDGETEKIMDLF